MFATTTEGIPEEYLFRTGGSNTVRGYNYQSLGVSKDNVIGGGSSLGVASLEFVHWVEADWGVATFVDVGNAAKNWHRFHLMQGYGVGVRYKTPAGPIAVDLAYGKGVKRTKLDFSIAIAF